MRASWSFQHLSGQCTPHHTLVSAVGVLYSTVPENTKTKHTKQWMHWKTILRDGGRGGIGNWKEDRYNSAFAIKTVLRINSCLHNCMTTLTGISVFIRQNKNSHLVKKQAEYREYVQLMYKEQKVYKWLSRKLNKKKNSPWQRMILPWFLHVRSNLIMPHRENVIDKLYSIRGLDACIQVLVQHVFVCM